LAPKVALGYNLSRVIAQQPGTQTVIINTPKADQALPLIGKPEADGTHQWRWRALPDFPARREGRPGKVAKHIS